MASKQFPLVRGHTLRATRLDSCGNIQYGDGNQVTTAGYISVALTGELDEGEAIEVKNAGGDLCIDDQPAPKFKFYTAEITFCDVDPELYAMMTNQSIVVDENGDAVGFRVNSEVSADDANFALEVWTGIPADACEPGTTGSWGYMLLPRFQGGTLGDFTIENAAINFTVSGAKTLKGSPWGVGPYNVIENASTPSQLLTAIGTYDHLHLQRTTLAPATAHAGARPVLDPGDGDTTVTDLTNGGTALNASLTMTPALDGSSEPFWIDWGDDSDYDYITTASPYLHTYAAAGTYTVTVVTSAGEYTEDLTVTP